MSVVTNSDFDVNILQDCLSQPNIDLTFPLPTDRETYVELDANEKAARSFKIIDNFLSFITRKGLNFGEIYSNNEYRYSINKFTPQFNNKMKTYMNDKLENSDTKLDELVNQLIEKELRLNLIKGSDYNKRFNEVKQFMVSYYKRENDKNMPTFKSHGFIRVCYITVMSVMMNMFPKGIWCKKEELSNLYKKYLENPMSIIYLPNHQSHIDYITIHLILIRFQLATPTVIAGDNLNVAIFGQFLRNLGAIYIKRSFNNELYTERNLSNLIEFILLNKIAFEVFIEGTRSRDGKLLLPKYGVLKTLVNIYLKQISENKNTDFDMLFQPVSITFERIYEADGYLRELTGKDKKQESFTTIVKNGVGNIFSKSVDDSFESHEKMIMNNNGEYDNSTRDLNGKIFVKLGESFKLSEFVADKSNLLQDNEIVSDISELNMDCPVNLKKLGFKILHEINRVSFLPPMSLVGSSIQAYYYVTNKKQFHVKEVLPLFRLLAKTYKQEEGDRLGPNMKLLNESINFSDEELIKLFRMQIFQFVRYVKINFKTNIITIDTSIELLYYKNLTIHLIIHKCLASYILLNLKLKELRTFQALHDVFYIFTGFLKNEFLFDYNFNKRNDLSEILNDLTNNNKIQLAEGKFYEPVDTEYLKVFAVMVEPFFKSYKLCIQYLQETASVFEKINNAAIPRPEMILNDEDLPKYFPTTKALLKSIQSTKGDSYHLESMNKQYLLSCLYYLDNLRLIKIFKNKARTLAYVTMKNPKDLTFISLFLNSLIGENQNFLNHDNLAYVIDIINKNFDRIPPSKAKL